MQSPGADPGFREGGSNNYTHKQGGAVTARGYGGVLIVTPVGPGAKPQPPFYISMKMNTLLTVISPQNNLIL